MENSDDKELPETKQPDDFSTGWVLAPGEKPPTILSTRTTKGGTVIHTVSSEGDPSQIIMIPNKKK